MDGTKKFHDYVTDF